MIAVVGHEDLRAETSALVERELRVRLERYADPAPGLVRAGSGPSVAFARAVRAAGRRLVVLLPARGALPAPLPPPAVEPARAVTRLADEVRLLAYDPRDRDARVRADEALVRQCDRLLAVWDGSPTDGRDATAHLVAYARTHGVRVEVVWPVGAARSGGATAAAGATRVCRPRARGTAGPRQGGHTGTRG
ncbi:hypothetical protein [Streptomyces sp. NPDC004267]|uniref:hypothetical protein n=1 Tax=Streptomyces sp. NPDC004267 TaxID=3364694 RepID=UPI00369B760F